MFWIIFGFVGQAVFSLRFIVQWVASEKEKKSVVPVMFWYLSIVGSIILLIYSIYRKDPVFILGQLTGAFIYFRNLVLIKNQKQEVN
ncbi:MAG: lipid-A-disaccharide synthase N-terminal domain-containing protein [Bacteroidota bacterium]